MGPLPEKILAKKLKKREKKKAELLKQKKEVESEAQEVVEEVTEDASEEEHNEEEGEEEVGVKEDNEEVGETTAELAVEKIKKKKKKHKLETNPGEEEPEKKKKKKFAVKEVTNEGDDIEVENKDNVTLPGSSLGMGILSDKSFSSLAPLVSEATLQGIADMGFTTMTEIQAQTIPHLLEGRDLVGAAKTGSGKTLSFLVPCVELIYKLKFMPRCVYIVHGQVSFSLLVLQYFVLMCVC